MGDGVIDDAQVIFEIGQNLDQVAEGADEEQWSAGGDVGKVILQSVTLTIDRPTNGYSGIGNEVEVAVGYGTRSASMSTEQIINSEAAELLEHLYTNDRSPQEVSVIAGGVLDTRATKLDWNNLEVSFEDDGDATISMDAKIRGLDIEANPDDGESN